MARPAVAWLLHCLAPLSAGVAAAVALHGLSGNWIWAPLLALLTWGLWSVLHLSSTLGAGSVNTRLDARHSMTEEDPSEDYLEEQTNASDDDQPLTWNPKPGSNTDRMDHAAHLYELARLEIARVLHQPYKSRLGRADKVCVKVATDQPLSSIPSDLTANIQASLSALGLPRHQVLDIAARPGCITFSLEVRQTPSYAATTAVGTSSCLLKRAIRWLMRTRPTAASAAPAAAMDEHDTTSLAAALLPVFTPLLSDQEVATGGTSPIHLLVQGKQFAAQWDPKSSTWCLQASSSLDSREQHLATGDHVSFSRSSVTASSTSENEANRLDDVCPRPCLGCAYQVTPVAAADHDDWLDSFLEGSRGSHTSSKSCSGGSGFDNIMNSSSSSLNLLSTAEQLHPMQAHVALLYASDGITASRRHRVEGWRPPADGQHDSSDMLHGADEAPLQLLVRCEGGYLHTDVQPIDDTTLQVEFAVPDSLLPRHHVGGPPVGLLPVTLELWQGPLSCISSTSLLLQVSDSTDGALPPEVWWWGARAGSTARMATLQLQATSWQLSQTEATEQGLQGWQDFLSDLRTWLSHIRAYASSSHHCISSAPATRAVTGTAFHAPSLTPEQMCILGEDLQRYVRGAGLHHVHRLFVQQQAVVRAALRCNNRCRGTTIQQQQQSWVALLWASVVGYCCSQCEARCHTHMCRQLGAVGLLSSMGFAIMGILVIVRGLAAQDLDLVKNTLPWTLSHILLLLVTWCKQHGTGTRAAQHAGGPAARIYCPASDSHTRWLYVLCYSTRMYQQLAMAVGKLEIHRIYARQFTSGTVLVSCLLVALGEQVQVGLRLPPPITVGLALLEVVVFMLTAVRLHAASTALFVGVLLCTVAPRLLVDMRLRSQVGRERPALLHASTAH